MSKKIILVGPTAAGKNFLREKFIKRGFTVDVSYTTREKRPGEIHSKDYFFLTRDQFKDMIVRHMFYEWIEYRGNYYGTGLTEWNERNVFIMETDGISKINPKDRKSCFIMFINPSQDTRIKRMAIERKWDWKEITRRLDFDAECFGNFSDYDMMVTNGEF